MQRIRQCARGTRAGLLERQRRLRGSRGRHGAGQGGGLRSPLGRGGKVTQQVGAIRVGEIEDRRQVAADGAAPGRDIRLGPAEALLDEAQPRRVVEHLRIDPAALGPRRQHVHSHTRPQPVDAVQMRRRVVLFHPGDELVVFAAGVHGGRAGQGARGVARRWSGRRHVIEEAVVLVEHQQQDGLAPDLGIGGQRIQDAGRIVRALRGAGRAGMFGSRLGGADPRHLRQPAVVDVVAQGLQEAAVRHGVGRALVQRIGRIHAGGPGRVRRAVGGVAGLLVGAAILLEAGQGLTPAFWSRSG
ncbi:hypothetical protein G6F57_016976 [Rhizopus arrhizus]|nr:hypothetical protein G6F57_016976 [Rhizopus arrhizus]